MRNFLRTTKFGRSFLALLGVLAFVTATAPWTAWAVGPAVRSEGGKYFDKDDLPTFNIDKDGTVDWYTYSGFRRYHSECHVCHGPDGEGSSYAPGLRESMSSLSYEKFFEVVVNGREVIRADKQSKMPALGENRNVMCYLDDIYVYLRARAEGGLPRGRPGKKQPKSDQAREDEDACVAD